MRFCRSSHTTVHAHATVAYHICSMSSYAVVHNLIWLLLLECASCHMHAAAHSAVNQLICEMEHFCDTLGSSFTSSLTRASLRPFPKLHFVSLPSISYPPKLSFLRRLFGKESYIAFHPVVCSKLELMMT